MEANGEWCLAKSKCTVAVDAIYLPFLFFSTSILKSNGHDHHHCVVIYNSLQGGLLIEMIISQSTVGSKLYSASWTWTDVDKCSQKPHAWYWLYLHCILLVVVEKDFTGGSGQFRKLRLHLSNTTTTGLKGQENVSLLCLQSFP